MIELESHVGGETVIRPAGDLDWFGATALRRVADDLLLMRVNFVIDLSLTNRVDATGANALLRTVRQAKALGVEVSIVNPNPTIHLRSHSTSNDAA